jgi:cobaltochelatase CobT
MRGMKGGNEIECLSRKSRRLAKLRPEHIRAAKRSFWKRQRSEAKRSARLAARDEVEAPPIGGLSSEPVRCRVVPDIALRTMTRSSMWSDRLICGGDAGRTPMRPQDKYRSRPVRFHPAKQACVTRRHVPPAACRAGIKGMIKLTQPPFWRRFAARPNPAGDGAYSIFTTAFDETVEASDLPRILPKQTPQEAESFKDAVRQFEGAFSGERTRIGAAAAALVRDLQGSLSKQERARTVVSFLIDHSGSMKGLRMLSALLAVEAAVDAVANAGLDSEILGFTTSTWRGGAARLTWQAAGKPRNPGRLCDIRHIVYAAADRSGTIPWHLRLALRPDLLRENIDGEALQWAGTRLDSARWDRRVICMISDGAPVDDSTLQANDDQFILMRHLEAAEIGLRAAGIVVGYLFIGNEHFRDPDLQERASEPEVAGAALLSLIRRALLPPTSG